jgi:hypothetical protein
VLNGTQPKISLYRPRTSLRTQVRRFGGFAQWGMNGRQRLTAEIAVKDQVAVHIVHQHGNWQATRITWLRHDQTLRSIFIQPKMAKTHPKNWLRERAKCFGGNVN